MAKIVESIEGLPEDMPKCECGARVDSGFKIKSIQFPHIHQCGNCARFYNRIEVEVVASELNTSGLHPLKHAVLVKPYDVEEVTKGGIVLPHQVQERDQMAEQRAVIIEIGTDADVGIAKVGDKVLFSKWSGQIAIGPADKKKYRVVNDRDIFLTIEDEIDV